MFQKVKSVLDLTQIAEENEDLLALPPCPPFMNDNWKCPLMAQCNVKGARGCR